MTNTDTAQQQLTELRRQYRRLYWERAAMLEALAGKMPPELQATLVAISETPDAEIDALLGEQVSAKTVCTPSLDRMQQHRDRWRGYAEGKYLRPDDYLDGNKVERGPSIEDRLAAAKAEGIEEAARFVRTFTSKTDYAEWGKVTAAVMRNALLSQASEQDGGKGTSFSEDPRTCAECGADLFPNYMEGCWEHMAKGCKFTGVQADKGWQNAEMIGPWRSERAASPKDGGGE